MKKKHLLTLLSVAAIVLFGSCDNKTLLDESRTFANGTWLRFTPEHYSVEVANTEDCYNFTVSLTVDTTRYRQPALPIMLEIESPSHERRTMFSTIVLRNAEGKWLGHWNDDGTLSITHAVRQYYFFNTTGSHSIDLSQRTSKYEIYGIKSLQFKIEKAKLEYPE